MRTLWVKRAYWLAGSGLHRPADEAQWVAPHFRTMSRSSSTLKGFLGGFNVELRDCTDEQAAAAQRRVFELLQEGLKTKLVVHRTIRSMEGEVGEFRARVMTELPRELGLASARMEGVINKFASLGALTTHDEGASVVCQSLIHETSYPTTAGIMAAAMVHAAPSILQGIQGGLSPQASPPIHALSAWSGLDFEQIHYDYAHLAVGKIVDADGCNR